MTTGIAKAQSFGQKPVIEPVNADPRLQQNFEIWRGHKRAKITRRQNEIGTHHCRFALGKHRITRRNIIMILVAVVMR